MRVRLVVPTIVAVTFIAPLGADLLLDRSRITGIPLPELCWRIDHPPKDPSMLMSSSAQLDPAYLLVVQSVEYSIGLRERDNRVVYISTIDPGFKTPEGLTTSSSLTDAMRVASDELRMEPGWAYYLPLKSGWSAGFFVGKSGTESAPGEDDTVTWFFKRRRDCADEPAS